MTGAAPRSRLRRNWPWLACVLVVLVTAGVLVGARLSRDDYETDVGAVIYSGSMPKGYDSYVRLPFGQVAVGLTKPRRSIDADASTVRPAPANGSFVGISVGFTKQYLLPSTESSSSFVGQPVRFELVVGTREYPVPADPLQTPTPDSPIPPLPQAWVAVDGHPTDVRVAVEYDGVRQLIDPKTGEREAGRAALLYTHPVTDRPAVAKSCGRPRLTAAYRADNDYDFTCMYLVFPRLPYVAGLGWAPAGKSWLTVSVAADRDVGVIRRAGDSGAGTFHSVEDDVTAELRLGHTAGAGDGDTNSTNWLTPGSGDGTQVGFFALGAATTPGTLRATVTYHRLANTDYRTDPDAPVDPTIRATWTMRVAR